LKGGVGGRFVEGLGWKEERVGRGGEGGGTECWRGWKARVEVKAKGARRRGGAGAGRRGKMGG